MKRARDSVVAPTKEPDVTFNSHRPVIGNWIICFCERFGGGVRHALGDKQQRHLSYLIIVCYSQYVNWCRHGDCIAIRCKYRYMRCAFVADDIEFTSVMLWIGECLVVENAVTHIFGVLVRHQLFDQLYDGWWGKCMDICEEKCWLLSSWEPEKKRNLKKNAYVGFVVEVWVSKLRTISECWSKCVEKVSIKANCINNFLHKLIWMDLNYAIVWRRCCLIRHEFIGGIILPLWLCNLRK